MLTLALAALAGTIALILLVAGLLALGLWWRTRRAAIKAGRTSAPTQPHTDPENETTQWEAPCDSHQDPQHTSRTEDDNQ